MARVMTMMMTMMMMMVMVMVMVMMINSLEATGMLMRQEAMQIMTMMVRKDPTRRRRPLAR